MQLSLQPRLCWILLREPRFSRKLVGIELDLIETFFVFLEVALARHTLSIAFLKI